MIPVTHAFYLAGLLFVAGLAAALAHRRRLGVLLGLEVMLLGAHLALVAAARIWAHPDGHALALLAAGVVVAQALLAAPLALALRRRPTP